MPLCVKVSCHCFNSSGIASPRPNSGLWNPRIFRADARFAFVNLVDSYRFERLMLDGKPVPTEAFVREGDLTPHMLRRYCALLHGGGEDTEADSVTSADSDAVLIPSPADEAVGASLSALSIEGDSSAVADTATDVAADDEDDANDESASCRAPILIPMRHFIPTLAARRKKNVKYKAGGASTPAAPAMTAVALTEEHTASIEIDKMK
jgi:hypothetical protein